MDTHTAHIAPNKNKIMACPLLAEALSVKATDSSAKYELVKTLVTKRAKAI